MSLLLVNRLGWAWVFVSSNTLFGHPLLHLPAPQLLSHSLVPWGPSPVFWFVSQGLSLCWCVVSRHCSHSQAKLREKRDKIMVTFLTLLDEWSPFLDSSENRNFSPWGLETLSRDQNSFTTGAPSEQGWGRQGKKILHPVYSQVNRGFFILSSALKNRIFLLISIIRLYLNSQVKARR